MAGVAHNPRAATAFSIRRNHFAGPHLVSFSMPNPPTLDGLRVSFGRPLPTEVRITTSNLHRGFVVVIFLGVRRPVRDKQRGLPQVLDTDHGLGDTQAP